MKEIDEMAQVWAKLKAEEIDKCTRYGYEKIADKFRTCSMMNGTESLPEICELLFKPQGREALISLQFPSLNQFRGFTKMTLEKYGVYIDSDAKFAEPKTHNNPKQCAFIGDTTATVAVDATIATIVIAAYGAHVKVRAAGWSVVNITCDKYSTVEVEKYDHAKILMNKK